MEESKEILMSSLRNLGIEIPSQITSIKDLDSSSFFSISSQSLLLLHNTNKTPSFPTSLPDSMAEKVNSCTHLTSLFQQFGYPFEISFHQFLYPSEEDLHKLVRFLVEKLSELSQARKTVKFADNMRSSNVDISRTCSETTAEAEPELKPLVYPNNQKLREELLDGRSETVAQGPLRNCAKVPLLKDNLVSEKLDLAAITGKVDKQETIACARDLIEKAAQVKETTVVSETCKPELDSMSCDMFSPELKRMVESRCGQDMVFPDKDTGKDLELHHLEEEHELLKEAMRMALDNEHSFSYYVEQLSGEIVSRSENLHELENQRDIDRKSLEEKKWNLLESLCESKPDCQLKLQKLKDIDSEIHTVLSEIRKREEECAKLTGEMKQKPKVASRRSYIERITEITKNSRKLDTDVDRILKETRELKLESNSIEERLHRTYAVVDETILREAKKDPVGRQAYKLLTNIHACFEKIREQILAANKAQREVAELEVKLTAIASRSLDRHKLQADLDAMRTENEHLEKTLMNH
ncbi:coiled-coil domain-containing protein 22 homolog [Chenopodium quinoa]|nr:coiled-coil domain-containing protein 22 homolog [Chenopodium quinoa]